MLCLLTACQKENPSKKQEPEEIPQPIEPTDPIQGDFRAMTYNIHFGVGNDNILNLDRIVEVIKNSGASIVALNEVDRFYGPRSGYVDQIAYLAEKLEMHYLYQGTTILAANAESGNKPREHGHALLSKFPIIEQEKKEFSVSDEYKRGILRAKLNVNGENLQVFVTHWALGEKERFVQLKESVEFMESHPGNALLMGDLNAAPIEHNIIALKSRLTDNLLDNIYTFSSANPTKKIDYIFNSRTLESKNGKIINSQASDHFPVLADLKFHSDPDAPFRYPNFPESFEVSDGTFINYEGGVREKSFPSGIWRLSQTAIVGARLIYDDKPVTGVDALRMRQNLDTSTFIQMNFDVPNGASKVTVWYSVYFKDVGSTWRLEQSKDAGKSWTQVGQDISDAEFVKKKAEFAVNVSGPVRFRINKLGRGSGTTGRLTFDDFAIYKSK